LVDAIAAQDEAAIAACFKADAKLRALVPSGLRERSGSPDAAALIAAWFEDSTDLELLDAQSDEVGDRFHISYRFTGIEDGERYLVEQQLFCIVSDDSIGRADLLCSGFRKVGSTATA
jgi:hypothetical protein